MKAWVGAAALVALAAGYQVYALSRRDGWDLSEPPDVWEWSEILFRMSERKFVLVSLSWFVGCVMGHSLAPHESRFRRTPAGYGDCP